MARVCLSLGSNLGDREHNIRQALDCLSQEGVKIHFLSSLIETDPWGYESGNKFLNAAALVDTDLGPVPLLDLIKVIEAHLGRKMDYPDRRYRDRPIDMDILLWENLVLYTDRLTIPHPLMESRGFVLEPLAQICPDWVHPVLGKTVLELYCDYKRIVNIPD